MCEEVFSTRGDQSKTSCHSCLDMLSVSQISLFVRLQA